MKYRELFGKLDIMAAKITLAQVELKSLLKEIKMIKSGLWDKHYADGNRVVKDGEL